MWARSWCCEIYPKVKEGEMWVLLGLCFTSLSFSVFSLCLSLSPIHSKACPQTHAHDWQGRFEPDFNRHVSCPRLQ